MRFEGADDHSLPDLQIVDLALVVPHEDFDQRRIERLAERLEGDGVIKNPPIVAPLGDGRFVVLDGANRVCTLKYLHYSDVIVQIVDYDSVVLRTWHHLVTGFHEGELVAALDRAPELRLLPCPIDEARQKLRAQEAIAFLSLPSNNGGTLAIHGGESLTERSRCLRSVVQTYNGKAEIHRVQEDDIRQLSGGFEECNGLVVFPTFRSADVLTLVRQGELLPSGISRHVIPGRALRLNFPLERLRSADERVTKNDWLRQWLRQKLQAREIRYYEEPTFLFDE